MPVDFRYFSALMAMLRGSRLYGSLVIGSTMLQMSESVGSAMNGSMHRRARVRDDQHVGGVDGLPAADRRAVEAEPFLEDRLRELVERDGEVLPDADEVHELQVDVGGLLLLGQLQDLLRGEVRHRGHVLRRERGVCGSESLARVVPSWWEIRAGEKPSRRQGATPEWCPCFGQPVARFRAAGVSVLRPGTVAARDQRAFIPSARIRSRSVFRFMPSSSAARSWLPLVRAMAAAMSGFSSASSAAW